MDFIDKFFIEEITNKYKPGKWYNVNELTQQKAISQLEQQELTQQQVAAILKARDALLEKLKTVDFISKTYPSDANFILAKVDDATMRYNQLIEKGIVIRNRTTQPGCENCLRFTIGTSEENEKLIKELKSI